MRILYEMLAVKPFGSHPSLGQKESLEHVECSRLILVAKSTQTGIRTQDQLVKSQLLYQLSYLRVLLDLLAPFGAGRDIR